MKELTVKLMSIEKDGLPPTEMKSYGQALKDEYVGQVGFLWDGNIYSGWSLYPEHSNDKGEWEESEFGHRLSGVTHWIHFSEPFVTLEMEPKTLY